MTYHIFRPPHSLVERSFCFVFWYSRHFLHIISIPVTFETFMSKDVSSETSKWKCPMFWNGKRLYRYWKCQRDVLSKVITFYEQTVCETTFCYTVSEDRMECWCCISRGLIWRTFICRRDNSAAFSYLLFCEMGYAVILIRAVGRILGNLHKTF